MKKSQSKLFACLAALALLHVSPVVAGNFSGVINGKSHHFNSTHDWNEDNFGLGLEYQFESHTAWQKIVMANGFRDSTENMSYMVGAGLYRRLFQAESLGGLYVSAGLNAFLMTRSDVNGNKPFPGILPSIIVGNDNFGINLSYMPKKAIEHSTSSTFVDPTLSGILFLQFKVSMDQLLP